MAWNKQIAIVGAAESDELGVLPNKSMLTLHAEAAYNALEDCGLQMKDVDGLLSTTNVPQLSEYFGITPTLADGTMFGGCSYMMHVQHAAAAIQAGVCEVALITHGESGRSRVGFSWGGPNRASPEGQFERPYGTFTAVDGFSMWVARHMHQYGTTSEQLAKIAVAARKWAQLNPKAFMYGKGEITVEDVLNSRLVAWPTHLLDCCLVTDGGGAVVVTTAERARDLKKKPVYLLGSGEATAHGMISMMKDFTYSEASRRASKKAFGMAGVTPKDIQHAMFYDAFTFTPLLMLEDLGFCGPGEGGPFVDSHDLGPGGDFPMNTNGGGLSYCHTGMYGMFAILEGVRQLRGDFAGTPRHVENAHLGVVHGPAGFWYAASTLILGTE
jgi:acetyl-CoA acetyltransferase